MQPGLRHERHQRVRIELGVRDAKDEVERAGAEVARQTPALPVSAP
jgi:hypothetical protein